MKQVMEAASNVAGHQTSRAVGRIGLGAIVAAIVLDQWTPNPEVIEYWRAAIIMGVNEGAYAIKKLMNKPRGATK